MKEFLLNSMQVMSALFIFMIGVIVLIVLIVYIRDISQNRQAIRKNYPVIGRFRYIFEKLGKFFRQYFFAMDREELPFNRAMRSWVYRAAKDVGNTSAFGSTRDLKPAGTLLFVNTPFPTLGQDAVDVSEITIGEHCVDPYVTSTFFHISAMSYGAISKPAVQALSHGAKMAGCWMNTGEGGLASYHLEGGADIVFQIGTAKYGVRDSEGKLDDDKLKAIAAHDQVKMFELKLSQGAKPGKGGILPAVKVTPEIAAIRGIEVHQDSISPNRHTDINDIDDLLSTLSHIREVTGKPVGFKAVIGDFSWIEELCEKINELGDDSAPDFITIDSSDGGSGAAPMSLMDYMGLPIKESLPAVVDLLDRYNLRPRIKVIASGRLVTPGELAWALCEGADFVTSARGFMMSLGCIQAMQCNKNVCPVGIATHDKHLQKGLNVELKSVRVKNYANNIQHAVCMIAHSCGVREPRQLCRKHVRVVLGDGTSVSLERNSVLKS